MARVTNDHKAFRMKKKRTRLPDIDLRLRAEKRLRARGQEKLPPPKEADALRLLHELQVHQIELEMQNEELLAARAEAESALERYAELYDFAPTGHLSLDRDGLILQANLTAAKLLGVARGRLVGKRLVRFVIPEDKEVLRRHLKELSRTGGQQAFEIGLIRGDDARFWGRVEANSGREFGGATVCRLSISDISADRQIKDTLRLLVQGGSEPPNEDFFRSLACHLSRSLGMEYVCIDRLEEGLLTAHTVAVYSDGKFEDDVSYTLKDTPCGDVVEKSVCCFPRDVRGLFPGDKALRELRAESYVGTVLWSSVGEPIGLIAVIGRRPLANPALAESVLKLASVRAGAEMERRQIEAAREAAHRRTLAILESIGDGFFSLDRQWRVTYVNEQGARLMGKSSAELLGKSLWTSFPQAETLPFRQAFERALAEQVSTSVDAFFAPLKAWFQARAYPSSDGLSVFYQDVTGRKQAEEILQREKDNLQRILDGMGDGAYVVNADHDIEYMNSALVREFGAYEGQKCFKYVHELQEECPWCNNKRLLSGESLRWQWTSPKNGKTYDFIDTPLTRPDGSVSKLEILRDITDLKRVENALREANERAEWLARFPEENPSPVLRVSLDGVVLYRNAAAAERAGWLCDVGQPAPAGLRTLVDRATHERQGLEADVELGGRVYTVAVALFPEEGYVNFYARDTTELRELRQREKEDAARRAWGQSAADTIAAMHEGVVLLKSDATVISVNPAAERLTGLFRDAMVSRDVGTLLSGSASESAIAAVRQGMDVLRSGGVPALPLIHLRKPDGNLRRVLPSVSLMKAPPGVQPAVVLTLTDVTDLYETAQRLEQSEGKYRELVENANSIIMRRSPDGTITFFNEYAQNFFGFAAEEVVGHNVLGTILADVDSTGRDMAAMVRKIGETPELFASNENENVCKDGRRVWVHWTNRAVCDARGNVQEILCVGSDITARKQMEIQNRRYQEGLHSLAKELAASEERDRWRISRYIHDSIVQNLSLSSVQLGSLARRLDQAGMTEEIQKIGRTRLLLDKAIEECRMVMSDLTPPMLYELGLVAALHELARNLEEKYDTRIRIEADVQDAPLENSLRGLLFQSTRELVMNALKHAGDCEVRVSVERCGNELVIRVTDNGKGFDAAAASAQPGTDGGFGLFSIRERVEGLGGRVDIESAPGKGTMATISVPVA